MKYFRFFIFFSIGFSELSAAPLYCKIKEMDYPGIELKIEELLKDDPNNVKCLLKLAHLNLKKGKVLKGYSFIEKAYNIAPEETSKTGVEHLVPEAILITDLYNEAIETKNPLIWSKIGDLLMDMHVYKEASHAYEQSLILNPSLLHEHVQLGKSLYFCSQSHESAEVFQEVLKKDPNNFEANYYLGEFFYSIANEEERAREYFIKASNILDANKSLDIKDDYMVYQSRISEYLRKNAE